MAVKIVILGRLADIADGPELYLDGPLGWADLLAMLPVELAEATIDARVKLALNGVVLADKAGLLAEDGDEIALLPPVSGG